MTAAVRFLFCIIIAFIAWRVLLDSAGSMPRRSEFPPGMVNRVEPTADGIGKTLLVATVVLLLIIWFAREQI